MCLVCIQSLELDGMCTIQKKEKKSETKMCFCFIKREMWCILYTNSSCCLSQFDYYNSMLINTMDEDGNYVELGSEFLLEENEHFNNLAVNTQQSNIQVPTNVYNKDPNILNAIYNSEALNDVFINNFQKDPTLTWQYFGSSTGFFRIYPGIKWTPDSNGVAAFDCRNRNWYIQAATSPKDIIIMVDISGSMKGLKMTIAKHTINTILDTLGENDFVNVIAYTDYVRYVEPCFKGTLVQADLDNREVRLFSASWRLKEANGQGSMCNQAIMLITDGAMEDFESVFEEFNWPERRVRVFTYLIGREMTFAQNTKWIACNNKGYYTHISTLADVQENVMEYLHVLSRPMVINHDHDIIWTEAIITYSISSIFLNRIRYEPLLHFHLSHGILLGVVGSDIPLMEVMKLAPRYMLGAHGYAFLITNNGYILAHPDLRPLYKDGKKLKPKPNYNSVDLSEVEWEDTDEKVNTDRLFQDTAIQVSLSPFPSLCSFGMVLTKGHGSRIFMGNVSVEEGMILHAAQTSSTKTYCETDIDPAHRKYTQLQAAIRYLLGKEPDLECDEVLLQQTLFDAVVTAPLEAYWNALMLNDRVEPGIETAFLGTRAGLMRIMRYAGVETRVAKKFLTPTDKDNLFTIDHFPLWYRLAVENTPGSFYYYPTNDKGLPLNISSALNIHYHSNVWGHPDNFMFPMKTHTFFMSHKQKKVEALQPCDTAYPGFMYDPSIREANSIIKCGRCQKMFVVQQVPDSNLVLVVTQADCDCSRQYGPILLEPKEIKYILHLMKSQKVRRRPESCHAYHPKVRDMPPPTGQLQTVQLMLPLHPKKNVASL
uniref:Calcium voltage-gated channel auxiliary subunit alpha2delta 4 n=1 Tax=Amphiprion percula TaxID=161767 RepID=A0A3P8TCM2_AMPPE